MSTGPSERPRVDVIREPKEGEEAEGRATVALGQMEMHWDRPFCKVSRSWKGMPSHTSVTCAALLYSPPYCAS